MRRGREGIDPKTAIIKDLQQIAERHLLALIKPFELNEKVKALINDESKLKRYVKNVEPFKKAAPPVGGDDKGDEDQPLAETHPLGLLLFEIFVCLSTTSDEKVMYLFSGMELQVTMTDDQFNSLFESLRAAAQTSYCEVLRKTNVIKRFQEISQKLLATVVHYRALNQKAIALFDDRSKLWRYVKDIETFKKSRRTFTVEEISPTDADHNHLLAETHPVGFLLFFMFCNRDTATIEKLYFLLCYHFQLNVTEKIFDSLYESLQTEMFS
jgi:hypothetical protein